MKQQFNSKETFMCKTVVCIILQNYEQLKIRKETAVIIGKAVNLLRTYTFEDCKVTINIFKVTVLSVLFNKNDCVPLNCLATEVCINFGISVSFY